MGGGGAASSAALRAVAWVTAGWVGLRALAAGAWVQHPHALEWQEAAMFEHAARASAGLPIYGPPSVEFTAFPYPPLFHWLGGLLVQASPTADGAAWAVDGAAAGLPALRWVSAAATVAVLACLVLAARRRWGLAAGLLSAGAFVAADGWTGSWCLLARVDALFLALTAASILVGTSRRALGDGARAGSVAAGALAGALGALAVLAKQVALGPLVALVVGLLLRPASRPAGVAAGAVGGVALAVAFALLHRATDGWFEFHVVSVLAGSPWYAPAAAGFPVEVLLAWAPLVVVAALATRAPRSARGFHPAEALALSSLVAIAWIGRAHEGGYDNTLLPAALALAWCTGPLLARLDGRSPAWSAALGALLLGWLTVTAPPASVPLEPAGPGPGVEALAARVRAVEGAVWQPHGAVDPRVPGGVHAMAVVDLLKSREEAAAAKLQADLEAALAERRFGAIVLGVELSDWASLEALTRNYRVVDRLDGRLDGRLEGGAALLPATGAPIGPRLWLEPR